LTPHIIDPAISGGVAMSTLQKGRVAGLEDDIGGEVEALRVPGGGRIRPALSDQGQSMESMIG
jgi:hypothetical protein